MLVPERFERSLTLLPYGERAPSMVYYWTNPGTHLYGGFLRFLYVGRDLYVVGSSAQAESRKYGTHFKDGGWAYHQFSFSKVARTADGVLTWRFATPFGRSVETSQVQFAQGALHGKTRFMYRGKLRDDYEWVADPLLEFGGNDHIVDLYGAVSAFCAKEFAAQLKLYPAATNLKVKLPREGWRSKLERLPVLKRLSLEAL